MICKQSLEYISGTNEKKRDRKMMMEIIKTHIFKGRRGTTCTEGNFRFKHMPTMYGVEYKRPQPR